MPGVDPNQTARPLPAEFSVTAGAPLLVKVAITFAPAGIGGALMPMIPDSCASDLMRSRYGRSLSLPRTRYSPGWRSTAMSLSIPKVLARVADGSPNSLREPAAQVPTRVPPACTHRAMRSALAVLMHGSAV